MDTAGINHMKSIVEALLLISDKPLMLDQIKEVLEGVSTQEIRDIILVLKKEYEDRGSGIVILEIAGGYQMFTSPQYAMYIRKFYQTKHKERLSKPSLETLAIIAYKQPVCRQDIEVIRGVNSDGVIDHLLDKNLIKIVGRKEVPGRPYLYGTTKEFLEYFGLRALADLPKLEDFASLEPGSEGNISIETTENQASANPTQESSNTSSPSQSDSDSTSQTNPESVQVSQEVSTGISPDAPVEPSQEGGYESQESKEKN